MDKIKERPEASPSNKDEIKLNFRPLTQGLGFHPFSDGLPYAPVSQTPAPKPRTPTYSQGTGAVAAGTPSFAKTIPTPVQKPVPRVSVPVAHSALNSPQFQHAPTSQPSLNHNPTVAEALHKIAEPTYGFVYLIKRVLAYLIDVTLNLALSAGALSIALMGQSLQPELLLNPGVILVSALFFTFFNWAIITAQEVAFNTTLGKRIFRLALNGTTTAIFLRAFFFLPSAGFLGAGLLWAIIDRRRRCWHDLIVDLQPSEIAKL